MRQLKISQNITNRESESVEKYLSEIGKKQRITPEQENILARARDETVVWSREYQKIINQLVEANLRFVVSVSKKYVNLWLSLSDLINEGNLGLIKAAHRFDHTKWFKFISYAVRRIRQSILQALSEQWRIVRLPQHKIWINAAIEKENSEFEQKYERQPTNAELAEIMEIDENQIATIKVSSKRHISLDAPIGNTDLNESFALIDIMKSTQEDLLEKNDDKENIMNILLALDEREREIILWFFGMSWALTINELCKK